ncbi:MAG: polyprenyl synthetase family protein [Treponema sp.]|nr:polyprenyl synthetase family protein [Treponema sp.]
MNQEYTELLKKIEAQLSRWLPDNPQSVWTGEVFADIGTEILTLKENEHQSLHSLLTPVKELINRGGKRWRPLLMTLVCQALGGGENSIPLSPLVEFPHNASLIHDDIEDDSDERRGKPAIHKLFGVDTAVNSASFLYFLATCCIENCGVKNKDYIYKLWTDCMRRLHMGQAMDINWHRNISIVPDIDDYFLMCKLKTGSLARLAVELGAHAAGAELETAQVLGKAADLMGVGFQILDDVKNLTTGAPGKKRGDDVVEGKKGLPVLLYLQKHPEKREMIFYYFHVAKEEGTRAPEVDDFIDALTGAGVFQEAQEKGQAFLNEAGEIFNSQFKNLNEGKLDLLNDFIKLIS